MVKRVCLILIFLGAVAACSHPQTNQKLFATYPTFKVFDKGYQEVWEAVLGSLKDYRLLRAEKENGYVKSALVQKNPQERFEFEIIVKRQREDKTSVTINNYIQRYQKGVGWKNITSNTTFEHLILTEIEKSLKKREER